MFCTEILRIDLPHKGESSFHIDMEEVVEETILPTGYPMTYEEFDKLKLSCDKKIFDDLFFTLNGQIWFKIRFETKKYLRRLSIPESFYPVFGKDSIAYAKEFKKHRRKFSNYLEFLPLVLTIFRYSRSWK